jgi:hypothetical protein
MTAGLIASGPGGRQVAPGPWASATGKRLGVFWYDLANVAGTRFFCAAFLLVVTGCQSDAGEICARLEECKLFPTGDFDADKCEDQVEQKVGKKRREQCAECVSEKECGQIKDACRSVCSPERQ